MNRRISLKATQEFGPVAQAVMDENAKMNNGNQTRVETRQGGGSGE
jgi:hypothetical protein